MKNITLVEVKIREGVSEKVIIETLSRMGICNKKDKILYPSCYLFKQDERIYIAHFKELFVLENGFNNISIDDQERRNSIIFCLKNWGLIDVDEEAIAPHDKFVFILPFREKADWTISHKFKLRYE